MKRLGFFALLLLAQPALAASNIAKSKAKVASPKTLVFTSKQCLLTSNPPAAGAQNFLAPLLGFLVPLAVEFVFDEVSGELAKVKKQTSQGSVEFSLWQRKADSDPHDGVDETDELLYNMPRCLTVVTGDFEGSQKSQSLDLIKQAKPVEFGANEKTVQGRLKDNGIDATKLYHVFETEIRKSDDGTSYHYRPVYFRSFDLLPGARARKQGVVYNLALRGPGATPWGTGYSNAAISLGEVSVNTELHDRSSDRALKKKLDALKTGELLFPGISKAAFDAYLRDKDNSIVAFMPASLKAEIVQTKKPSDTAKVLAAILQKAKPKASGWVGSQFDSDAKFAAGQSKSATEIAYLKAQKDLTAALAGGDPTTITIAQKTFDRAEVAWERVK